MKLKRFIAVVMAMLMCFGVASSMLAFAADGTGRQYAFFEGFSGGTLNTDQGTAAMKASGGLWANHQAGSTYTISGGGLTYTERKSGDYFDIRFYVDGLAKDLTQDFILSFRIKPLVSGINFEMGWRDRTYDTTFENKIFKIKGGKYVINGTAYDNAVLTKDEWSLVEIAYHYNEDATPVITEAGEPSKGAVDRLSFMLNGQVIATADASLDFYNIDQFRIFQWANGEYALDNLAIALGAQSLIDEPWQEPDTTEQPGGGTDTDDDGTPAGTVLFCEDFQDAINTDPSQSACEKANGFWACNNSGSTYSLADGTMKYTKRMAKDYMDIRFYYDKTAQNLSRSFVLSFKIKPLAPDFGCQFSWRDRDCETSDSSVQISSGRFRAGSKTYMDVVLESGEWYLVEIAFNYNKDAIAVTGERGAVESYTLMVNGKAVATVNAATKYHNIDHFRLFQWASCRYELDDLTVATGNATLDKNDSFKDWTPKVYYFDKADATDYAYSFCIVGDTQKVTKHAPAKLANIYDWIVDNADKRNIQYVFGLGDITDTDSTTEWDTAYAQINKLNGVVPYSLVRGNHDGSENMNKYFNNSTYKGQFEQFYFNDRIETAYTRIQVGDVKYLMMTFDIGPTDAELEWAADVIERYSDHRVIITTHTYLLTDGSHITGDHSHPATNYNSDPTANNGDGMWEKLISKHENVFLVISGHVGTDYVITNQRVGDNGNVVTEMLVDPQSLDGEIGATGMITMLYFSEDGREIAVETYSTVHQKYFLEENQYTVDISSWTSDGGNAGADGKDGIDGLVPYIGENGNWWIGDTDTGIKAIGDDGSDGADGATGADGKAGAAGAGCGSAIGGGAMLIAAMSLGMAFIEKKRR